MPSHQEIAPERSRRTRRGLAALPFLAALGLATIAGCSSTDKVAPTPHDEGTDCLKTDMTGRSLVHTIDVPGETFKIRATYSTDYDLQSWKITDTKTLDIRLEVVNGSEVDNPIVLIENLHADASLKSDKAGINGMKQDSFDDHLHAGDQPGFLVSPDHHYTEQFVIEGYSPTLMQSWTYQTGDYSSTGFTEKRLNEDNIIKAGVFGEEFTIVTDVLSRIATDPYFHKAVTSDHFLVPLAGHAC